MLIFFQTPVESGVHWMVQVEPSLKTEEESGAVGTGSARTVEERASAAAMIGRNMM